MAFPGLKTTFTSEQLAAYFDRIDAHFEPSEDQLTAHSTHQDTTGDCRADQQTGASSGAAEQNSNQHSDSFRPPPTLATLWYIHERHVLSIPFENLSLLHPAVQGPIVLDVDHLFDKLVVRKRGGYCYEMNLLFATVLRTLGYTLHYGSTYTTLPMLHEPPEPSQDPQPIGLSETGSHVILHVHLPEDGHWICDTGFGRTGLAHPVPLVPNAATTAVADRAAKATAAVAGSNASPHDAFDVHRVVPGMRGSTARPTASDFELHPHRCGYYMSWWSPNHGGFVPQYWFRSVAEIYHGDLEAYNTFASTHPNSPVRALVIVTQPTRSGRVAMSGWLPDQITLRIRRRQWQALASGHEAASTNAVSNGSSSNTAAQSEPATAPLEPSPKQGGGQGAANGVHPSGNASDKLPGAPAADATGGAKQANSSLTGNDAVGWLHPDVPNDDRKLVEDMQARAVNQEELPALLLEHFGIVL